MTLTFRCPVELDGLLPPPVPAALGLPDWFKAMPPQAFNALHATAGDTVKRCPPFIDAMTSGFLIPLICDVRVENGEFTWDNDLPPGGAVGFVRSPIGFHDASQVTGTPLFDPDRFLIKFHNLWTIEAPDGYSLLFTDVVMPGGVNGRQLSDEALRRWPGLKVLFTTGYTRNAIVHHGRLDPGIHLIGKPFSFQQLAARIRSRLDAAD